MTHRRTFFKRLTMAAAVVALAPQIAFRAPKLDFCATKTGIYEQLKNCAPVDPMPLGLSNLFAQLYATKKQHAELLGKDTDPLWA